MSTIVTRAGKGTPLTHTEADANFTNLNTDKLEINPALGTPASGVLTNCLGLPVAGVVPAATANVASAATVDLSVLPGTVTRITGTTATSAFTMNAGQWHVCIADAAWPLTYHATTNKLNTRGGSYTCVAGDRLLLVKDNSGIIQATLMPSREPGFVSVRDFGAVGDGSNETSKIQAAIDAVSAAGGGTVLFPAGIYGYTTLSIPAKVILKGVNKRATNLDRLATTSDGLVLAKDPDRAGLRDMTLTNSGAGEGWAINASLGVLRDLDFENIIIGDFLKGVIVLDTLNCSFKQMRINGTGKTVAGGIGFQSGNATLPGNNSTFTDIYVNNTETGVITRGQTKLWIRPILESCTTGMQISAPTVVISPWVSTSNTTDFSVLSGSVCLIGYGASNYKITYASVTERNRSVVIPESLDFASSVGVARIGGVTIGRDEGLIDSARGQRLQSFILRIHNDAGTLKHAIYGEENGNSVGSYSDAVISASATLTATPTGADATTAFATGVKIGSANTNSLILDTIEQAQPDNAGGAAISLNTSGTALTVQIYKISRDVNGVTRTRPELHLFNAATGAAFAITTANIADGKQIRIAFNGYLKAIA